MKELHELKEKLMDQLREYGKRDMNGSTLEVIDKLTHTIKNLCKIIDDEGYSGDYNYRGMGRYSRSGLTDKLHELMNEAPDERSRMEIKRLIDKM